VDDNDLDYDQLTVIMKEKEEGKEEGNKNKDRRKKANWVSVMATVLSLTAWAIMIAVWVILDTAAPDRQYGWLSFFTVNFDTAPSYRTRWNYNLVYVAYILMLASLGACAVSIILGRMRKKRKGDKINKPVYVIAGITVIGFIAFIFHFWYALF